MRPMTRCMMRPTARRPRAVMAMSRISCRMRLRSRADSSATIRRWGSKLGSITSRPFSDRNSRRELSILFLPRTYQECFEPPSNLKQLHSQHERLQRSDLLAENVFGDPITQHRRSVQGLSVQAADVKVFKH